MTHELRFAVHPSQVSFFTTDELREHFHIPEVFIPDTTTLVYSMYDRMITMGVMPVAKTLKLDAYEEYTKASYFLERRELGIINIGGDGKINVDGQSYQLAKKECLYIGKGSKEISFESVSSDNPALFYINSTPAHTAYPTTYGKMEDANQVHLGSKDNCNERTIFQFIHEDGIQSCQLVMGYTDIAPGSIWNTFPPHTHYRRMEVYFYFDLAEGQVVMHFMGDPEETRHIVMKNQEAVISPEWSIHSGAGTSSYSFVWAMGGENKAFTDMDGVDLNVLK